MKKEFPLLYLLGISCLIVALGESIIGFIFEDSDFLISAGGLAAVSTAAFVGDMFLYRKHRRQVNIHLKKRCWFCGSEWSDERETCPACSRVYKAKEAG